MKASLLNIAQTAAAATGLALFSSLVAAPTFADSSPAKAVSRPMTDLTLERLYASPSLNGSSPMGVKYSPDGKRVTFLKAKETDQARYDLWQFDVATGEQSLLVDSRLLEPEDVELSEEAKALRERKRTAGKTGILDYSWGTADTILIPLGGDLHLVTLTPDGPQTRQLTDTDTFEYDANISPRGKYASFIRDGALWMVDLASGEEKRLSPEAEPDKAVSYGVAEFVAQEEMSRYTGYWWSPDDRYVAYTRVDESPVDVVPRFDIAAENVTVIEQRYPRAGRPNAKVDLFVLDIKTGETTKLYSVGPDTYLARVNWSDDSIWFQTVNRDQTEIRYHRSDGKPWRVWSPFKETQKTWVNLSSDFTVVDDRILQTTEKTGYRQVYELRPEGGDMIPLTRGDWVVSAIEGVDTDAGLVYFTGYADTPLEKHLYSIPIATRSDEVDTNADGDPARRPLSESNCIDLMPMAALMKVECPAPQRITETGKSWSITMAPDGRSFVGTSSAPDQPPQTGLYKADGTLIAWLLENKLDESHPYYPYLEQHTVPEYGTLTANDGQTLYYSIQTPPDFDDSKKYPAIIEVYGGPHVQTVDRDWESLSDQYLSRQGYIVFRLDNRGSWNRGKKFEDVIYHQTGKHEVADQLEGVKWLKAQPFVDADRIAIQGWSYGGYMTLMTVLQAPEGTFAAAVAGAAVTDWSLYDTFYTERYMGTPENNPEGYDASSVFPHVDNLETPLLLVHGMADDNVTFDNATRLMAMLQEKGKLFELMTYPGQRHGVRGEALQVHLMKTRMEFLNRHLKAGAE
ncbi:hypothetical protein HY3_05380 [Hyphomonas pacifica]|uniref:Peptidase S9 n=2 Tax=Hyphomonas pacifica TaxID=1280941 RepID=A0A8B2PGW8_9PROT|nr:hypothetical protein HY3_05380 [Hyphomonas pacifica]RAN38068.1 hypothetical protein HY11_07325 [Hyphomonas pacifica]